MTTRNFCDVVPRRRTHARPAASRPTSPPRQMSRGLESSSAAIKALLPLSPAPQPCSQDLKRRKSSSYSSTASHGVTPPNCRVRRRPCALIAARALLVFARGHVPKHGLLTPREFTLALHRRAHHVQALQSATIEPDPSKADVFLVPFLMGCNAMLGWGHGMQRVNAREHHAFFGDFKTFARKQLPHFAKWPHRHLFLFPLDSMFAPRWLLPSMVAHTAPATRRPAST